VKEENPYQPPEKEDSPPLEKKSLAGGCKGAFSGCLLGGVAIPMATVLLCRIFMEDLGGLAFWILVAMASAFVGTIVGFLVGSVPKPNR
jgi:hypothetical protein